MKLYRSANSAWWLMALACAVLPAAEANEPLPAPTPGEASPEQLIASDFAFRNGELISYSMVPYAIPLQTVPSGQRRVGTVGSVLPSLSEGRQFDSNATGGDSTQSEQIEALRPTSTAQILQDSPSIQTVNIQRRSSIAFDPRVRGYHLGQVFSQGEGAYLFPVRPDLDAALSKIDPLLISQIDVISGPYSSRYGPGFAFIDIDLSDSPRYEDGYQAHNRLGYTIRANGGQHYLVDSYWGGSADYGFLINYTYRQGNSYFAGNGQRIPSAYLANNVSAQFGVDLARGAKLEMRYDFLDQGFTQYPGQFFDVTNLQTNSFNINLIDESSGSPWTRMQVNAWHYRTPSTGVVSNDPIFQTQARVEQALETFLTPPMGNAPTVTFNGTTSSQLITSGGRWEFLFGEEDYVQWRTGVDLRHQRQYIREHFDVGVAPNPPPMPPANGDFTINTELPSAEMFNPGIYAEMSIPFNGIWTSRVGTRVDYVHTTTRPGPMTQLDPAQRTQDNTLYAFYLMNDVQLTDATKGTIGFGHAQRPPTLLERYSDGVFVSVLQSGFSRVIGKANLAPERLWQFDAGLTSDYGDTRVGANFFYSWIVDYITFEGATVLDPTGARLLRYTPTPLATLTGFEFKGERDLSSSWTAYLTSHLVQGQDQTLGVPLWGISPLEGQVGLRWSDPELPDALGMELNVRVVATQNRLGVIRAAPGGVIEVESATPTFVTVNLRGYWNPPGTQLRMSAGVDNLLDATYLQHLDLRLPAGPGNFPAAFAYSPGIMPYVGIDWTY